MSVFRRKYRLKQKDGTIKSRQSKYFTINFTATDGNLVRRATRLTNRAAALVKENELRLGIERAEVGLIDKYKEHRGRLISEIIDEFIGDLLGLKRDDEYCYIAQQRLRSIAQHSRWMTLRDMSLESLERGRSELSRTQWRGKARKPKTINQYVDIAIEFAEWCVRRERIGSNPLLRASKSKVIHNPHYRRAATPDELQRLFDKCSPDRRLFYRFVLYSPLRRDTLEYLRWEHLHLKDEQPWGETPPEHSKDRKRQKFAIRKDIAAELIAAKGKADSDDFVFAVPSMDDMRADLIAAGIPFADKHGNRRLDLHAFRKTLIKMMKASGVPLERASKALLHNDIATTQKYYDEDEADQPLVDDVEQLPSIGGAK